MFQPHRIDIEDVRAGDGLHWKKEGLLSGILAPLIHKLKEPDWDAWDWHLTPVVKRVGDKVTIIDARFPKSKLITYSIPDLWKKVRAYRVVAFPPDQDRVDRFVLDYTDRPYDFTVYFLTALRIWFDIPRIIDRWYDCWEILYDFYEFVDRWCPDDGTDYDWKYPWLPDLRRAYGEIPLKKR